MNFLGTEWIQWSCLGTFQKLMIWTFENASLVGLSFIFSSFFVVWFLLGRVLIRRVNGRFNKSYRASEICTYSEIDWTDSNDQYYSNDLQFYYDQSVRSAVQERWKRTEKWYTRAIVWKRFIPIVNFPHLCLDFLPRSWFFAGLERSRKIYAPRFSPHILLENIRSLTVVCDA